MPQRHHASGTPVMGTYGFHYCPGVLGGDTYDGYIEHQFHELKFAVKLCLEYEEKNGEKLLKREFLVSLKGEFYFVKFIINSEEGNVEPSVILGRSFFRLAKGIVDFGNGILTIYLDTTNFDDDSSDDLEIIFANVDNVDVTDLPSLEITDIPHFELSREELEKDLWERIMILSEKRPVIETLKYSDQHKKLLDSVLFKKLKLDGEIELEEEEAKEEMVKEYKAIKEKEEPGVFVLPIRLEAKLDLHALADIGSNINVMPYRIFAKLGRDNVKPIEDGIRVASGLRPYHFTYPERKLTMEEMLYKFIDEGKREQEETRAFICDFQTTNEILFKERKNLLIELRLGVQELLKVINNTPMIDCEVKGVTTRGGKTTAQDAQINDTNIRTEEPLAENHDEPVKSNEILTNDQPQKTNEPDTQPSNKIQTLPIPFPRRLRKEKEEAQQKKFLENLKQLHINLPFIEALAQMPMYAKFLKDMPEDSRVHIILGRPCLATARAMIDIFNKKITLRVGDDEVIFDVDQSIKRPPNEDDECYRIDYLDNAINAEAQELLANDEPDSFLSRGLEKSIDQSDLEGCEPVECNTDNDSNEPIWRIMSINTPYLVVQETAEPVKVEREHLYSASANEIDEKKLAPLRIRLLAR
ncbi:hypothetical protein Tco_0977557 [Tanacetum coccineum]|uniref:Uncharacterized protein n=1 Tax=Tanacetum coccineum TaxID=301880 RepID=A0ABQ5EKF2_9ASTR